MDHAQVVAHTADRAAEQIHIEIDAALQVCDPQDQVVDVLDGERSHAGAPCGDRTNVDRHHSPAAAAVTITAYSLTSRCNTPPSCRARMRSS
ncbi:hypothetical protein D3C71_1952510 [compost metagenome]